MAHLIKKGNKEKKKRHLTIQLCLPYDQPQTVLSFLTNCILEQNTEKKLVVPNKIKILCFIKNKIIIFGRKINVIAPSTKL